MDGSRDSLEETKDERVDKAKKVGLRGDDGLDDDRNISEIDDIEEHKDGQPEANTRKVNPHTNLPAAIKNQKYA